MPAVNYGRPNSRLHRIRNLLAGPHGPGSKIFEELSFGTVKDLMYWFEDFGGLTAAEAIGASKVWQYTETTASPVDPVKTTPTYALASYVQLDYGVTDNSNGELVGPAIFVAKASPFFEARFQIDVTLANNIAELTMGFVGALPAAAADILGDIDTPTLAGGVTDAAVFGIDTDETLKTAACVTIGTSTAVGKTTVATGLSAPFTQPTINVDVTYRVELRSASPDSSVSTAFFFINDLLVAERVGPDAEKLMTPAFLWGNRGTNSKILKIDYLELGQEKSGSPF